MTERIPAGGCDLKGRPQRSVCSLPFFSQLLSRSLFLVHLLFSLSSFFPFFSFIFFLIFLETLFCQSLSAATQAWVEQQQMHSEMHRLGNELRRVRGREHPSLQKDWMEHPMLMQPETHSNRMRIAPQVPRRAEHRTERFITQTRFLLSHM